MFDLTATVTCDTDLEQAVGSRPAGAMLKTIDHLDDHAELLLRHTRVVVIGAEGADGTLHTFAVGGEPGFARPSAPRRLAIETPVPDLLVAGAPAATLTLVPGYGETLRANGTLAPLADGAVLGIDIDEVFLHCAKAILRSGLWSPTPEAPAPATTDVSSFLTASPFALLTTVDGSGHADVSPKGDPAGLIRQLGPTTFVVADRPGNRRTDSLHNLMGDPRIAILALCPGRSEVVELRGQATVCTDPALLADLRLRDRTPKAAVVIEADHQVLRTEPALAGGNLWQADHVAPGVLPPAADIWADHVRRNNDPGLEARVARRLVNSRVLAAGIAKDYRTNL